VAKRTCDVLECDRPSRTRGLCPAHYARFRRYGSPTGMPSQTRRTCAAEDCTNDHYCKGYCAKHYERWRNTGSTSLRPKPTELESFADKIKQNDEGCWIWSGGTSQGYGAFRKTRAHRWAYENLTESPPIPDGWHLDHLCRVPLCCNPDHLEAVTPKANMLRGVGPTAINASKTHCKRGHEFTPKNTYVRGDTGHRQCKQCRRDRVKQAMTKELGRSRRAWRKLAKHRLAIASTNSEPCHLCGGVIDYTLPAGARWSPTADHLDPPSLGHPWVPTLDRVAPAHHSCNSSRGNGTKGSVIYEQAGRPDKNVPLAATG